MKPLKIITNGIGKENPTFGQVIGMCPALAVTTSAINGFGMGISTLVVLACSNVVISLIRKLIPDQVRIPAFIIVIAGFSTAVHMLLQAYLPTLNDALGIFIPLIVVNCILLARAETFASKNGVFHSLLDGVGMGIGFTLSLTVVGIVREFLGAGTIFGLTILPEAFPKTGIMILPPGAFITLGFLMALITYIKIKRKENKKEKAA